MATSQTNRFKRVMCGLLSALTMLSGAAVAGTAVTPVTASAAEIDTSVSSKAGQVTPDTFSWDNATVYFLLTDRFCNGNTANDNSYNRRNNLADKRATFHGGDFAGITQKINDGYFNDLGVDAIWLSAPYEQIHGFIQGGADFYHYSYHGYYVLDYTETDANFGTKEEFRTMVDTAHEHGIRIIMDIVMNHAGYISIYDMDEYGFGELKSGWDTFYANPGSNAEEYQSYINYKGSADAWAKWWGSDWLRSGISGYTEEGGNDLTNCLAGLPDFRTESTKTLGIPAILQTKWTREGTLAEKSAKYGSSGTVTDFITKWLAEWVREYGVDGFRCDTAKHVEKSSWKKLKDACVPALREWKSKNENKKIDDLDFWMTGEHWNHGVYKDDYYTTGGFDSMINFDMTGGGSLAQGSVSGKYDAYANAINKDDSFNVLSYISSHDTTLARGDNYYLGSAFLMLPGAVQIYYGDETARPKVSGMPDDSFAAGHCLRSDMNWESYDPELLAHWGKVGNFRNHHIAVGAGDNTGLTASNGIAFGRTYSKNGLEDKVAGVIGATANTDVTVDVSAIWANGTMLENYYDENVAVVSDGKVTFNSGAHGTILIQEPDGERGRVTVTHIDQDSGKTMKKETLVGLVGESFTATPLTTDGYKLARTVGSTTGTYSATEGSVTFYYTFDSNNYAHIEVKHVDAETNAEIAESDSLVGRIGSTYTTEAKTIKNYEVDTIPSNAAGTVQSGTITVTYKYNYVEPSNLQVHYYNANGWSSVNLYAYDESGSTVKQFTGAWPGKAMTAEGDNWYFCDVPETETAQVMFNAGAGGPQEPAGTKDPGYPATGEVFVKNATVYPAGKVNVKYIGTNGKVLGSEIIKGMADGTNTYTTTAKTFSGYTLSSTPANATGKFTEASINVTYTYTSNGPVELVNNSTASSSITLGESITVNASATGGTAPYTYSYYYKKASDTSWSTKAANTTAASVTIKPGSAVTYQVKVDVTDSAGTTKSKTMSVTVNPSGNTNLVNKSSVKSSTITLGDSIVVYGSATGGSGSYKYTYMFKQSSQTDWTTKAANTTATSVTIKPGSAVKYDIMVIAIDSTNKTASSMFTVNVVSNTLTNNSNVASSTITLGNSINITGAASGGTAPYTYSYYFKQESQSEWTTKAANTSSTSVSIKPGSAVKYNVKVVVKDSNSKTAAKTFTVTVNNTSLTNNSKVASTTITLGSSINITGAASGGTAPYTYSYYFKKESQSDWTTKSANTSSTSVSIKPGAAVKYNVKVVVKDSKSKTAEKTFTVTVKQADLSNNSKVASTSISLGNTINITGAASGGTAPYTYSYYYKKSSDSTWSIKYSNTTSTSVTVKPGSAVKYDIKVVVVDNKGNSATKIFTVTVNNALVNNSKVASSTITLGNSINITGAASGGTSPYTYSYYFKKDSQTDWTTKLANTTTTSVSIKPGAAVKYNVKVVVKDKNGTTSTKTFTVTVNNSTLTNNSKVASASIKLGNTINITGAASGGTAPYTYSYYFKKASQSSWTTKAANTTSTSVTVKPGEAVNYNIKVVVTDNAGKTAAKEFVVTVSTSALTNTSTLSSSSITLGKTVTLKGSATGGSGSYSYAFYFKQSQNTSWTLKGEEYGSASSVTLTPGASKNYDVKICVRDNNTGEVVSKEFLLKVS